MIKVKWIREHKEGCIAIEKVNASKLSSPWYFNPLAHSDRLYASCWDNSCKARIRIDIYDLLELLPTTKEEEIDKV